MSKSASRGRPPASSRDILQDAAFDLFLERSYAHTSIADITQRAGVSRATFFNYFSSKSDVFWVDLDEALDEFRQRMARVLDVAPTRDPAEGMMAIVSALDALADRLGATAVPFALTQSDLIGSVDELQASALARFSKLARDMEATLTGFGVSAAQARTASYSILAAAISAAQEWADAGPHRGPLTGYLRGAVEPIAQAFTGLVPASR